MYRYTHTRQHVYKYTYMPSRPYRECIFHFSVLRGLLKGFKREGFGFVFLEEGSDSGQILDESQHGHRDTKVAVLFPKRNLRNVITRIG